MSRQANIGSNATSPHENSAAFTAFAQLRQRAVARKFAEDLA